MNARAALFLALFVIAPARAEFWAVADLWALDPAAVPVTPATRPDITVTRIDDRPDGRRCLVWWDATWRAEYRGCLDVRPGVTVQAPPRRPAAHRGLGHEVVYPGPAGTPHLALDDAKRQAEHLMAILDRVRTLKAAP